MICFVGLLSMATTVDAQQHRNNNHYNRTNTHQNRSNNHYNRINNNRYIVTERRIFSHYTYEEMCYDVRQPYTKTTVHVSSTYANRYGYIDFGINMNKRYNKHRYNRGYMNCEIVRTPVYVTRRIQHRR